MKTTHLLAFAAMLLLGLTSCGSGSPTGSTSTGGEESSRPSGGNRNPGAATDGVKGEPRGGPASGSGGAGPKQGTSATAEPRFVPPAHHDSGGGSEQFVRKGGDNSVQEYGGEGTGDEFREAAAALHAFLDARAAGAWEAACNELSTGMIEQLVSQLGGTGGGRHACPEVLDSFESMIPPGVRRAGAEADVAALRAEGDSGFLLYRGAHGEPLFIPVHREGGDWKVAGVGPSPLS